MAFGGILIKITTKSNSKNKGDIIIHFTVTLPKNLDNSRKDILKQVLPQNKRNNMVVDDNGKYVNRENGNLGLIEFGQSKKDKYGQDYWMKKLYDNLLNQISQ
jgi:DnaJ-class molecular chaperone